MRLIAIGELDEDLIREFRGKFVAILTGGNEDLRKAAKLLYEDVDIVPATSMDARYMAEAAAPTHETLRDKLAMAALVMANLVDPRQIAIRAYAIADAMIDHRAKVAP